VTERFFEQRFERRILRDLCRTTVDRARRDGGLEARLQQRCPRKRIPLDLSISRRRRST
jgi:hypothetical protein